MCVANAKASKIGTPKAGKGSKGGKGGKNKGKDVYYTESNNPKDILRVFLENEAKLNHIFCQVLSDVLVTNFKIDGIESFKKKCKSDKIRNKMIQEAKKIHTSGGNANFRDFEKFVRKFR